MQTNPEAKTILCYGDSNTWGLNPRDFSRIPCNKRWTGLLQDKLGSSYEVKEEGLCGRTFSVVRPGLEYRTGLPFLKAILDTHDPIDICIIMLGTNDLKDRFDLSAEDIGEALQETISAIEKVDPKIYLIVACPYVTVANLKTLPEKFSKSLRKSEKLSDIYRTVCEKNDCNFIDCRDIVDLTKTDGFHFDEVAHEAFFREIASLIKNI